MFSELLNTRLLSFSNALIYFLFRLPLATLWKKFELQSPSLTHFTLAFCVQCISSLKINSSNSPFLKALWTKSSGERPPSCSMVSKLAKSNRILFFLSFSSPKEALFHSFNLALTNSNFLKNLWPCHPFPWNSLHQLPKRFQEVIVSLDQSTCILVMDPMSKKKRKTQCQPFTKISFHKRKHG